MNEINQSSDPLDYLWNQAEIAAKDEDFQGVLRALKALGNKGVWQAHARIGEIYESGATGVERNIGEALTWYRRAVFEGDDPTAHLGLGRAHYEGQYVARDYVKALNHFQKAFNASVPQAGIYLGIMHYFGIGLTANLKEAEKYFSFAAEAGFFLAYGYLARIKASDGHFLSALRLFIGGWLQMFVLLVSDRRDPRLLGIRKPV